MINLLFLSVYKKHWIRNVLWFKETKDYYIFKTKDRKALRYLDKDNNLLLKKVERNDWYWKEN